MDMELADRLKEFLNENQGTTNDLTELDSLSEVFCLIDAQQTNKQTNRQTDKQTINK